MPCALSTVWSVLVSAALRRRCPRSPRAGRARGRASPRSAGPGPAPPSDTRPTRRPLRSTVIRSEISYTWSRKCDTNRIAAPPSRSRRITRNSSATSSASRLDVGSSRISTRAETAVARAMATSCWTAIGWAPRVDLGSMVRSSSPSSSAARRVHRAVVDPAEAAGLAAQQNVLCHSQIGAEVDLLVDGADAGVLRLPRAAEPLLDAVDRDAARVDVVDAGERLDQRRLTCAVLPHQRMDLAGQQPEVDAVECLDAGEVDGDVPHVDHGLRRGVVIEDPSVLPSDGRSGRHDGASVLAVGQTALPPAADRRSGPG